jgi:hypothetical protein
VGKRRRGSKCPEKESPNLKMPELQDAIPVPDDPDQDSHCSKG